MGTDWELSSYSSTSLSTKTDWCFRRSISAYHNTQALHIITWHREPCGVRTTITDFQNPLHLDVPGRTELNFTLLCWAGEGTEEEQRTLEIYG